MTGNMEYLGKQKKAKVRNAAKHIKKYIKIYNSVCQKCRVMIRANPQAPLNFYCKSCQEMIKDVLQ